MILRMAWAKQVLKSFEKRRKKNLPVALEHSSEVSQSAILVVDLTGKKPIVVEGENAIRDMPVVSRKKVIDSPEKELEYDLDDDQEEDAEEVENEAVAEQEEFVKEVVGGEDEFEEAEKEVEFEEEEATRHLPEKLQDVVNDLYDSLIGPHFNRTMTQTPAVELNEFSFVPLSASSSESLHLASFKEKGILAEKTRSSAKSSYSLRCYNTYLARSALVEKIMELDPSKTEAQVIYSLREKVQALQGGSEMDWENLKKCCFRGKALFEFNEELNLGTYGKVQSDLNDISNT